MKTSNKKKHTVGLLSDSDKPWVYDLLFVSEVFSYGVKVITNILLRR